MGNLSKQKEMGRIAFRAEGNWWVAYYALPDTMEGALELARIQMSFVVNHPQRKDAFMKLIQQGISSVAPEFLIADQRPAPEHERSGAA